MAVTLLNSGGERDTSVFPSQCYSRRWCSPSLAPDSTWHSCDSSFNPMLEALTRCSLFLKGVLWIKVIVIFCPSLFLNISVAVELRGETNQSKAQELRAPKLFWLLVSNMQWDVTTDRWITLIISLAPVMGWDVLDSKWMVSSWSWRVGSRNWNFGQGYCLDDWTNPAGLLGVVSANLKRKRKDNWWTSNRVLSAQGLLMCMGSAKKNYCNTNCWKYSCWPWSKGVRTHSVSFRVWGWLTSTVSLTSFPLCVHYKTPKKNSQEKWCIDCVILFFYILFSYKNLYHKQPVSIRIFSLSLYLRDGISDRTWFTSLLWVFIHSQNCETVSLRLWAYFLKAL